MFDFRKVMGRINHIPTGMQIQVVKVNAFLFRSL